MVWHRKRHLHAGCCLSPCMAGGGGTQACTPARRVRVCAGADLWLGQVLAAASCGADVPSADKTATAACALEPARQCQLGDQATYPGYTSEARLCNLKHSNCRQHVLAGHVWCSNRWRALEVCCSTRNRFHGLMLGGLLKHA